MTAVWFVSKRSGSMVKPWNSLCSSKAPGVTGPRRFSYGGGPLLLHHGSRHAAGLHGGAVHPGERGMEVGLRDPGHRHAHLHRVVPGRVPDLHAAQAHPFMRITKVVAAAFR